MLTRSSPAMPKSVSPGLHRVGRRISGSGVGLGEALGGSCRWAPGWRAAGRRARRRRGQGSGRVPPPPSRVGSRKTTMATTRRPSTASMHRRPRCRDADGRATRARAGRHTTTPPSHGPGWAPGAGGAGASAGRPARADRRGPPRRARGASVSASSGSSSSDACGGQGLELVGLGLGVGVPGGLDPRGGWHPVELVGGGPAGALARVGRSEETTFGRR